MKRRRGKRITSIILATILIVCCCAASWAAERRFTDFITTNSGFFAIRPDGTVYTSNLEGEFDYETLCAVEAWTDIVDIKWSWQGVMGLKSDGRVVYSGAGDAMKVAVNQWRNVVEIECRSDYLYGLCADGTVYSVNKTGEVHPTVDTWRNVRYITSYVCGSGEALIGISEDDSVLHPNLSIYPEYQWSGANENIVSVDSSGWLTLAMKADGTIICSGEDRPLVEEEISTWRNMKQVCAGDSMALGLREDGTVVTAGYLPWLKDLENWYGIDELFLADENNLVAGIKQDGSLIIAKEPENYNGRGSYDILGRSGGERITQLGYVHNYGKDPKLIGFTEDGKFFVWNLS